jgi:hypothetical protein
MFMRICAYFPFSARISLNQRHWLGNRVRENGAQFKQCSSAFLKCCLQVRRGATRQDRVRRPRPVQRTGPTT